MYGLIMEKRTFEAGQAIEFPYPFIRVEVDLFDGEGMSKQPSWQPGIRYVQHGYDDALAVADGIGKQCINIISIHKPGQYPERVFYTRRWYTPDGKIFGKRQLRIKATPAFRRLVSGYEYPYELATEESDR